jgi:hypothetical protein
MGKAHTVAVVIAWLLTGPAAVLAQDSELAGVREEMKQLQRNYEERMQALEKRLTDAEARAANAERTAAQAEKSASDSQKSAAQTGVTGAGAGRGAGDNAFNPAISLIMQGTWARTSQDPNNFFISGFMPSGGEVGPPKRSFGLGETELAISANIDPYFRGLVIASLSPDNTVELEEAYFQTLALPQGFTLRAGRFLSGIGYQNEIHQHAWDFQDAPLPYKAFLGGRYLQDGLQLRWIAPTPFFLEVGGELASGAAFPGNDRNKNGAGSSALFAHIGGDIGESYAWRSGVSYLRTAANDRSFQDPNSVAAPVTNSFTGRAKVWVVDGVLKWAPLGNSTQQNIKLQAEYFRSQQDGTLTYDDSTGAMPIFGSVTGPFSSRQSGWYAQSVYQFMPRWRVGYRYDALRYGSVDNGIVNQRLGPSAADFSLIGPYNPSRNTAMLDFSPSEFSRLRLQIAQDKSRQGATDNQVFIQYIHSLGPHGAHRF